MTRQAPTSRFATRPSHTFGTNFVRESGDQGVRMRTNLALLLTLAVALAVGCSKNQAGNSNSSGGSNPSADNGAAGATGSADNSSASQSGTSAKLSDTEKQLLQKVADADKAEIEMGQLAQSNAASPKVKDLGQKLVDDHTQNQQQLEQIAQQKGVQLQDQEKPDEQSMKTKM